MYIIDNLLGQKDYDVIKINYLFTCLLNFNHYYYNNYTAAYKNAEMIFSNLSLSQVRQHRAIPPEVY